VVFHKALKETMTHCKAQWPVEKRKKGIVQEQKRSIVRVKVVKMTYLSPTLSVITVITPRFIEELDNEGRLIKEEYLDYGVIEQEHDKIGEMCDPHEGL